MLTRVSVGGNSLLDYEQVLGPQHLSYEVARQPGEQRIQLYVEGLSFPDANFLGLVSLSVSLVDTKVGAVLGAETGSGSFRAQGGSRAGRLGAGAPEARWSSLQGPLSPHSPHRLCPRCPSSQTPWPSAWPPGS